MALVGQLIAAVALLLISGTAGGSGHPRPLLLLPPATCTGKDFATLVEDECGGPPLTAVLRANNKHDDDGDGDDDRQRAIVVGRWNGTGWSVASREDCERGVTARELRRNIAAVPDVQCVAQILVQTASVDGIEDGLRIDTDFNFLPACGVRESDPDVVAMKGIALAILTGGVGDSGLVPKVVNGLVPSLTPADDDEKEQSGIPSCSTHPPPSVPCHTPPEHSPPHGGDHKHHGVNRTAVLSSLGDRALMLKVFTEDPNQNRPCLLQPVRQQPVLNVNGHEDDDDDDDGHDHDHAGGDDSDNGGDNDSDRRRRILATEGGTRGTGSITRDAAFGKRRLQCADCDNADSFPCAYCWQRDVCGDMYWC